MLRFILKDRSDKYLGGTVWYQYDESGQRTKKVWENGGITKMQIYIGEYEVWREYDAGSQLEHERQTIHISGEEKRFVMVETQTVENYIDLIPPTVNTRYQYGNQLNSACLELNEIADLLTYEEYHPFGTSSIRMGNSQAEVSMKRYRYNGKERDEETGLYYYGARYYADWLGRFISVDPLANESPDLNPYHYVRNNPVGLVDPSGMQGIQINVFHDEDQTISRIQFKKDENLENGFNIRMIQGENILSEELVESLEDYPLIEAIGERFEINYFVYTGGPVFESPSSYEQRSSNVFEALDKKHYLKVPVRKYNKEIDEHQVYFNKLNSISLEITSVGTIYFEFDKPEQHGILEQKSIQGYPDISVEQQMENLASLIEQINELVELEDIDVFVLGHTDIVGRDEDDEYNIQLSERRAEAVSEFLKEQGVPDNLIQTSYYGSSGAHQHQVAKDRRADIFIIIPR